MHSILFIANGPEASMVTDVALRRQQGVVTRASTPQEATLLLASGSFDAIVCAVDSLDVTARQCIDTVKGVERLPTVIITGSGEVPLRSFDIDTRIVSITDGIAEVCTALNQQLRRIPARPKKPIQADCEFEFGFSFKAEPSRIGKARAVAGGFIQRCLQLDDKELIRVELVLEEALANAVYHGSLEISSEIRTEKPDRLKTMLSQRLATSPYCDRRVQVQLAISDEELRIVVSDDGPGFDVDATAAADDSEAVHRPSGRGLLLMHAFADSVKFNESGNSVQLSKKRSSVKSAVHQEAQQQTAIAAAMSQGQD